MASQAKRIKDLDSGSDSESDSRGDEEGWNDVEEDEEEVVEVISLLDDRVYPDVMSMLTDVKVKHGFDFLAMRQRLQLDFHGSVRLVNYIRHRVHEGLQVTDQISKSDFDDDRYLKPVLDDDAVIMGLFDLPEVTPVSKEPETVLVDDLLKRNAELQEQLSRVTEKFEQYRVTVAETLDQRWEAATVAEAEASSATGSKGKGRLGGKPEDTSKYYWESYAYNDIHETMLKDTVRTDSYRDFIYNNKHLFAGKVVLDIGCGTGILSMFAARAGASKVLAVDASDIIDKARENVFHAGLSSTITLIKGRMEEVTLPVDKVDIIVSEWMGYCLLFEAMLPSVLYARDKYLKPDGLLVPDVCNMWIAPVADEEYVMDTVGFWRDVYGFDMRAMQAGIWDDVRVLYWPSNTVVGSPVGFKLLDLYTVTVEDLQFTAAFRTTLTEDIDGLDGFILWFDTFFSPSRTLRDVKADTVAKDWACADPQNRVAFTTGPFGKDTHWKQGLLLCKQQADGEESGPLKKGQAITGSVTFRHPEDTPRGLVLKTTWGVEGENEMRKQSWDMR